MKRCLLLLLILFQLAGYSQITYQHYLNSSVQWTREFSAPYYGLLQNFSIIGDTTINATKYWNVHEKYRANNNGAITYGERDYMGLREDSLKHFYIFVYGYSSDSLWYNFNLQPTDSFWGQSITTIDTVNFDGEMRQRFTNANHFQLVEGIGVMDRSTSINITDHTLCFFKDTATYQLFSGFTYCGIISGIEESNNDVSRLNLYPNPAKNIIHIALPDDFAEEAELILQNSLGEVMQHKKVNRNFETDISNYPNGIYYLKLSTGNKTAVAKILKSD